MPAAERSGGAGQALEAPRSGALDLHEGIVAPPTSCKRWPEHLVLRSSQGEIVRGRCRATNLCAYCATLMAVETSELLMLDAMEDSPELYAVLTARELLERADCRRHLEKLRRSLRRRWPAIRWAVLVEFQRRGALHLNLLVKGVPAEDAAELHERMSSRWCDRVDAEPQAQFVARVTNGGGLVRYVAQHFLKPAQAPPIGWRGHRVSYSRSYLVRPAAELRAEARRSLRLKRELRAAREAGWSDPYDVELAAQEAMALADATSWELVQLPREALCPGNVGSSARGHRQGTSEAAAIVSTSAARADAQRPAAHAAGGPGGDALRGSGDARPGRIADPLSGGLRGRSRLPGVRAQDDDGGDLVDAADVPQRARGDDRPVRLREAISAPSVTSA